jgi:hypothetical protein
MCAPADPAASTFLKQLLAELTKVSGFYVEQAQQLEVRLHQIFARGSSEVDCSALCAVSHAPFHAQRASFRSVHPSMLTASQHLQGVRYCG